MQGFSIDGVAVGQLHQVAQIHHRNTVGNILHDVQVVGDEHIGQVQLLLQILQQIDDLALNGNVQSGDGLIAHNKLRLNGQSAGNADTLTLTAGKLVREAVGVLPVQADSLQQLIHALLALGLVVHIVDFHALRNDSAHRHTGIQRSIGVLKNNLGLPGIGKAVPGVLEIDFLIAIENLALGGVVDTHDHAAQSGLTAAGLAHHAQSLAFVNVQGDIIHGHQGLAGAYAEMLGDVLQSNELLLGRVFHSRGLLG